jgi:hypothetical protein
MPRSKIKVPAAIICRHSEAFEQYVLSRSTLEEPILIAKRLMAEGISVKYEDLRKTTVRVEAIRRRKMTGKKSKYGN